MKNYVNHTEEQIQAIKNFMTTGEAFISNAWRNEGDIKPITLMFEAYTSNSPSSSKSTEGINSDIMQFNASMLSQVSGVNYLKRKTMLVNLSEEQFDKYFTPYGYTSDMVDYKSRDSEGNLIALGLALRMDVVFDQVGTIIQIDSIKVPLDDEGLPKEGWQIKQVNGQELTRDGKTIYMKRIFAPLGTEDLRIQQDQVFGSNSNNSTRKIEENKTNTKKVEAKEEVEIVEDGDLTFDF